MYTGTELGSATDQTNWFIMCKI